VQARAIGADSAAGQVYVYGGGHLEAGLRVTTLSWYSGTTGRILTPILLEQTGFDAGYPAYTVRGVGTARVSAGNPNTAAFGLQYGSDVTTNANYTFGFINARIATSTGSLYPGSSTQGAVEFDNALAAGTGAGGAGTNNLWYFTPSSFGGFLQVGRTLTVNTELQFNSPRTYSATLSGIPAASGALYSSLANTYTGIVNGVNANGFDIATGDFNGDGKVDFATSNYFNNSISVYTNNGSGGFTVSVIQPPACNLPGGMAAVDLNGDGKLDLVVVNNGSNSISVLLNNGSGFTASNFVVSTAANFHQGDLRAADVNQDGRPDLLIANFDTNNVTILVGDGAGGFTAKPSVAVGTNPVAMVVGDFNGDARSDFATIGNDNLLRVMLGDGTGGFTAATGSGYNIGGTSTGIAIADLNGDGKQDVVVSSPSLSKATIFLGNASSGLAFSAAMPISAPNRQPILADLDGDGKPDYLMSGTNQQLSFYRGDGAGGFGSPVVVSGTELDSYFAVADFDGDGRADAVALNFDLNGHTDVYLGSPATTASTLTNNGSATVTAGTSVPLSLAVATAAGFATPTASANTVSFREGATVLGTASQTSGPWTFSTSTLGAGTHTITAVYPGDAQNAASTSNSVTVTVNAAGPAVTVTLTNLTQTYTGSPLNPTATPVPSNATVTFLYTTSGNVALPGAPTAAGTYNVTATATSGGNTGTASGVFTIDKAAATVAIGTGSQTYTGSPLNAAATTSPVGLSVGFTYVSGGTTLPGAPTVAGTYNVTGNITDPNYAGSGTGTLTITRATATVTLGNLTPTYTGSPVNATAGTSAQGNPTIIFAYTSGGTALPGAPTTAGTYGVTATISDANYQGSATGAMTIGKATATVTLGSLSPAYTGSPLSATVTTVPGSLAITLVYSSGGNALPGPPTAPGTYTVVATVNDTNYQGTATGSITIGKGTATVTLGSLSQTYTGSPLSASAITTPNNLTVTFAYSSGGNALPGAPTPAGSYGVVATILDSNYQGTASGTLAIGKANATVTLGSLSQTYTGSPLSATATTSPLNLNVSLTYNNSATVPTGGGSYNVVGTIVDANYQGSATGTLVIGKATGSIAITGGLNLNYSGTPLNPTVVTGPTAGLGVSYSYVKPGGGPVTGTPVNAGSYQVTVSLNDPNYQASTGGTLAISPVAAAITVSNTYQTWDGTPKGVTVLTSPSGLPVTAAYYAPAGGFTWNDAGYQSATPPTDVGQYQVDVTIADPNYTGTIHLPAMLIAPATLTTVTPLTTTYPSNEILTATVTWPSQKYRSDVGGDYPTGAVTFYNGATAICPARTATNGVATCNWAPQAPGTYSIAAQFDSGNRFNAGPGTSAAALLTVNKQQVTIGVTGGTFPYDGNAHPASADRGNSVLTYKDSNGNTLTGAPVNAGTYSVLATYEDTYTIGTGSGTVVITKATATVSFVAASLTQTYDGTVKTVTATTSQGGLPLTYSFSASPVNVGSYTVTATVNQINYQGSGTATLKINKGQAGIVFSNLQQAATGRAAKAPTVTTSPAGLLVSLTYTGPPNPPGYSPPLGYPSQPGSYTVTATVVDPNYTGSASANFVLSLPAVNSLFLSAFYGGSGNGRSVSASFGNCISFTVVFSGSNNPTGLLSLLDGGAVVYTQSADPTGAGNTFSFCGLSAGTHTVTAAFAGDAKNFPSNSASSGAQGTVTANIAAAPNTTTLSLAGSATASNNTPFALTATVGYAGAYNHHPATGSVAFMDNGSTVGTVALSNGVAVLSSKYAAGTHAFTASYLGDAEDSASTSGTLNVNVAKAVLAVSQTGATSFTYDGTPKTLSFSTTPAAQLSAPVYFDSRNNQLAGPPTAAGTYTVTDAVSAADPSYQGTSAAVPFTIRQATASIVALGNLSQAFDGTVKSVSYTTNPPNLAVSLIYELTPGVPTAFQAAGTYTVIANISDPNYAAARFQGVATITAGALPIAVTNTSQDYTGAPRPVTVTPSGITYKITYTDSFGNVSTSPPTASGYYTVDVDVTQAGFSGHAEVTLMVKAPVTLNLSGNHGTLFIDNQSVSSGSANQVTPGLHTFHVVPDTSTSTRYAFSAWTNCSTSCVASNSAGDLTLNLGDATHKGSLSYTAVMVKQVYVDAAADGPGGTVTGAGYYTEGAPYLLAATPNPGYALNFWNIATLPRTATISYPAVEGSSTVHAVFTPAWRATISASPASGGTFNVDYYDVHQAEQIGSQPSGGNILITKNSQGFHAEAVANPGYVFKRWSGTGWDPARTSLLIQSTYFYPTADAINLVANFQPTGPVIVASAGPVYNQTADGTRIQTFTLTNAGGVDATNVTITGFKVNAAQVGNTNSTICTVALQASPLTSWIGNIVDQFTSSCPGVAEPYITDGYLPANFGTLFKSGGSNSLTLPMTFGAGGLIRYTVSVSWTADGGYKGTSPFQIF
jgi:hypothetical protein